MHRGKTAVLFLRRLPVTLLTSALTEAPDESRCSHLQIELRANKPSSAITNRSSLGHPRRSLVIDCTGDIFSSIVCQQEFIVVPLLELKALNTVKRLTATKVHRQALSGVAVCYQKHGSAE